MALRANGVSEGEIEARVKRSLYMLPNGAIDVEVALKGGCSEEEFVGALSEMYQRIEGMTDGEQEILFGEMKKALAKLSERN